MVFYTFGGREVKKTCLRDSYAKKIVEGKKEYKPLRTKHKLQARTTLKTKTQFRDVYAEKLKSGEKEKYKYKPKTVKSKEEYHSILTNDMTKCYMSGDSNNVHVHHIFGASNRSNSETYGFVVPLRADWHNMADYGVHFDRNLDLKLKRMCQDYWLKKYGTQEQFIIIFGKWW